MPVFDLGRPPSQHYSKKPGYNGTSLQAFFALFPDDDACLDYMFRTRFGPDPSCPRCGEKGRWRRHAVQKHYFHPCGGIISPMAGTVFDRSKVPLQLCFYAMLLFADSSDGVSTSFLQRQIGVSPPTAFRMSQRIRMHLAALDSGERLGTPGDAVTAGMFKVLRISNTTRNSQNSVHFFVLADNSRVDVTVVTKPRQKNLRSVIEQKVNYGTSILTNCYATFRILSNYESGKPISEFIPDLYDQDLHRQNSIHGFMQYFNMSFPDRFRGVTREKSWLYAKEYEFRYNRRITSADTFHDMISRFPIFNNSETDAVKRKSYIFD